MRYLQYGSEFPFLIGRIKSLKINNKTITAIEFPFLIGRIKSYLSDETGMKWNLGFHSL